MEVERMDETNGKEERKKERVKEEMKDGRSRKKSADGREGAGEVVLLLLQGFLQN